MSNNDYISEHSELFKDYLDEWLFKEFGILSGCCSSQKSFEYNIARLVLDKFIDKFID